MKSIIECLGSSDFSRIRIGIGDRENKNQPLADYVLGKFTEEEMKEMKNSLEHAADSAEKIIQGQIDKAMNLYN